MHDRTCPLAPFLRGRERVGRAAARRRGRSRARPLGHGDRMRSTGRGRPLSGAGRERGGGTAMELFGDATLTAPETQRDNLPVKPFALPILAHHV